MRKNGAFVQQMKQILLMDKINGCFLGGNGGANIFFAHSAGPTKNKARVVDGSLAYLDVSFQPFDGHFPMNQNKESVGKPVLYIKNFVRFIFASLGYGGNLGQLLVIKIIQKRRAPHQ